VALRLEIFEIEAKVKKFTSTAEDRARLQELFRLYSKDGNAMANELPVVLKGDVSGTIEAVKENPLFFIFFISSSYYFRFRLLS